MTPIYQCLGGSHLYGTQRPTSDLDIRGVFIDDQARVFCNKEALTIESGEDTVMHPLRKFHALMVKGNPTIFEMAYAPESAIIMAHPVWSKFNKIKSLYISQNVMKSYIGYLNAQILDFQRHERDLKALVHAYRLAVQLVQLTRDNYLNPVLEKRHKDQIKLIYDGLYSKDVVIMYIQDMIEAARQLCTFPEWPNLDVIEPVICEMYMEIYRKGN